MSGHKLILITYSQGPTYNLQNVDVTADTTNKIDMGDSQRFAAVGSGAPAAAGAYIGCKMRHDIAKEAMLLSNKCVSCGF